MPRRKSVRDILQQSTRMRAALAREGTIGSARANNNRARYNRVRAIAERYERNIVRSMGGRLSNVPVYEAARIGALNTPVARRTYMGLNNG